jgi:hypothetical protein
MATCTHFCIIDTAAGETLEEWAELDPDEISDESVRDAIAGTDVTRMIIIRDSTVVVDTNNPPAATHAGTESIH